MLKFELNEGRGKIKLKNVLQKLEKTAYSEFKKNGLISVAFISGKEMKKLNTIYRQKEKTTDILTFVMDKRDEYLGEILLYAGDLKKRARASGKTEKETAAYLLTHGLCHIFGYTHNQKGDTKKMEAKEKKIMDALNL